MGLPSSVLGELAAYWQIVAVLGGSQPCALYDVSSGCLVRMHSNAPSRSMSENKATFRGQRRRREWTRARDGLVKFPGVGADVLDKKRKKQGSGRERGGKKKKKRKKKAGGVVRMGTGTGTGGLGTAFGTRIRETRNWNRSPTDQRRNAANITTQGGCVSLSFFFFPFFFFFSETRRENSASGSPLPCIADDKASKKRGERKKIKKERSSETHRMVRRFGVTKMEQHKARKKKKAQQLWQGSAAGEAWGGGRLVRGPAGQVHRPQHCGRARKTGQTSWWACLGNMADSLANKKISCKGRVKPSLALGWGRVPSGLGNLTVSHTLHFFFGSYGPRPLVCVCVCVWQVPPFSPRSLFVRS